MNQQSPTKSNASVQISNIIGPRPLLFFILALIIGESFFAAIILFANLGNSWKGALVIIAILYLFLLLVLVGLFAWFKPKNLMYDQRGHMLEQVFGQFGDESNVINYAELIMERPIEVTKFRSLPSNAPRQLPGPDIEENVNG